MNKKILLYSEHLEQPFDEGIKKTAWIILNTLSEMTLILGICRFGKRLEKPPLRVLHSNRLLINNSLRKAIKNFAPDIILYIPSSCGTFASFLRMKILHLYHRAAKALMLILQPKKKTKWQKKLLKYLRPDKVLTSSPDVMEESQKLKIPAEFIPLGLNSGKFKPLKHKNKKDELRKKYGLSLSKFIILHIGHINWIRNLEALIPLQKDTNQVVLVASTSTPKDSPIDEILKRKLHDKGIIIIDKYIEHIHELYQLSDVYVFPVTLKRGCVSIPLSVLEARACGIPVISTDFGGLRYIFKDEMDGVFYSKPEKFLHYIELIRKSKKPFFFKEFNSHAEFLSTLKTELNL